MTTIEFKAIEYTRQASFREAAYRYEGSPESGWRILRNGEPYLELPPGYVLLQAVRCGICSTDLARHLLPFALPQIIGHEVVARDTAGRRVAVEINASHLAVGSPRARNCPLCSLGLATHCPERLVLGIDRLPGGFAPWILAPLRNLVEIPEVLGPDGAVLVEPFAAAFHATERISLEAGDRVAVLGVGRLGLLIVAALKARREASGIPFSIEAVGHRRDRLRRAEAFGADRLWDDAGTIPRGPAGAPPFQVVIDSTGNPRGLELAALLADREVHVKSTTGLGSLGLTHVTELVVDEVSLERFDPDLLPGGRAPEEKIALTIGPRASAEAADILKRTGRRVLRFDGLEEIEALAEPERRPGILQAPLVVVETLEAVDKVLRPETGREQGWIRPTGTILVVDAGRQKSGILAPILDRGLRISTSRCGDFRRAIPAMVRLFEERVDLGLLVTDTFPVEELPAAFERARSPESIKIVVDHPAGRGAA